MVAISTDDLRGGESAVSSFNVEFPILYTAKDSSVPESYGVFNLFGDGLASASLFLVTAGNEIRWQDIGRNYQHFVDGQVVVDQVQQLNQ